MKAEYGKGSLYTKEGLKNYYMLFYRDGKQHQVNTKIPVTGKDDNETTANRKTAEDMLAREVAKKVLDIRSDLIGLRKITYEDLRAHLITAFKSDSTASLSTTKDGDDYLVGAKWLDEYFSGMTLEKMADTIAGYHEWFCKQPEVKAQWQQRVDKEILFLEQVKRVSPKTARQDAPKIANAARNATFNRSLSTLRSMYSQYSMSFPKKLSKGDIPYMPRIAKENSDNVGQGFVEPKGYEKILAAMPDNLKPITQFMYYTGMRSGEVKKITWGMVTWGQVEGHKQEMPVEIVIPAGITKNRKTRTISLVGPLAPIAETLSKGGLRAVDMPVFDATNFRRVWNKIAASLGLGILDKKTMQYHGIHPHDFRRSAARNLIRAGVSQSVAMKITGHKSPAMFTRYNITDQNDVVDALKRVGTYIEADAAAQKASGR